MKFLVALACLGVSSAAPIFPPTLPYTTYLGGAHQPLPLLSSPVQHSVAAVPRVATYANPAVPTVATYAHPNVAAVHPYQAPALSVAHVPVVKHVGYKVTHNVQHIPKVSVARHISTHTTQHVINHPPVSSILAPLAPSVPALAPSVPAPAPPAPSVPSTPAVAPVPDSFDGGVIAA